MAYSHSSGHAPAVQGGKGRIRRNLKPRPPFDYAAYLAGMNDDSEAATTVSEESACAQPPKDDKPAKPPTVEQVAVAPDLPEELATASVEFDPEEPDDDPSLDVPGEAYVDHERQLLADIFHDKACPPGLDYIDDPNAYWTDLELNEIFHSALTLPPGTPATPKTVWSNISTARKMENCLALSRLQEIAETPASDEGAAAIRALCARTGLRAGQRCRHGLREGRPEKGRRGRGRTG
jgi:hypothetical protein